MKLDQVRESVKQSLAGFDAPGELSVRGFTDKVMTLGRLEVTLGIDPNLDQPMIDRVRGVTSAAEELAKAAIPEMSSSTTMSIQELRGALQKHSQAVQVLDRLLEVLNAVDKLKTREDRPASGPSSLPINPEMSVKEFLQVAGLPPEHRLIDDSWALEFLKERVFSDPMFIVLPTEYLAEWKKQRGGYEVNLGAPDTALEILELLARNGNLEAVAVSCGRAGFSSNGKQTLSQDWSPVRVVGRSR